MLRVASRGIRTLAGIPAGVSDLVTLSPAPNSKHDEPRTLMMSLNRPPVNALNTELLEAISGTIKAVENDGWVVIKKKKIKKKLK